MKAAVLYEARKPLQIEEMEMPTIGDGDVLIRVAACGVCHTDLKALEGTTPFQSPSRLGHEVSGTIEQVGKDQRAAFVELKTAQSSPLSMAGPSSFTRMVGLSADNESLPNQW